MEFKLGELFCGPGGLAIGATRASISDPDWKIVHQWATDYDEDTCNTYRQNICPDRPESVVHADIRELDYSVLKELGDIDGLAFGFPC
ncbi:DNA cytosine methyltransferase, partial [uncultured Rothia sp.]